MASQLYQSMCLHATGGLTGPIQHSGCHTDLKAALQIADT